MLFGQDWEARQCLKETAVNITARVAALMQILVKHGICTEDEIDREIAIAETAIDQSLAEVKRGRE